MKEIVSVHIGHTGCGIGQSVWKLLCSEHGIGPDGIIHKLVSEKLTDDELLVSDVRLDPFFYETASKQFVPRALFLDPDPGTAFSFDDSSLFAGLFRPENLLFGKKAAHPLPLLRRELERCDCPAAFYFSQSLLGTSGGIINLVSELCPKLSMITTSQISASPHASPPAAQVNFALCLESLIESVNLVTLVDNDALLDAALNLLQIPKAPFSLLNDIAASSFGSLSCPTRYPYAKQGPQGLTYAEGLDLCGIAKFLTPIPKLPFAVTGFTPLTPYTQSVTLERCIPSFGLKQARPDDKKLFNRGGGGRRVPTVRDLCWSLFSPLNFFASFDPLVGRYVKALAIWRGETISRDEIIRQCFAIENHGVSELVDPWIHRLPSRIHSHCFKIPEPNLQMSASFMAATTAINPIFKQAREVFASYYKRKAFLHRFYEAGTTDCQIQAALETLQEIVDGYDALEELTALKAPPANESPQIKMLWP